MQLEKALLLRNLLYWSVFAMTRVLEASYVLLREVVNTSLRHPLERCGQHLMQWLEGRVS